VKFQKSKIKVSFTAAVVLGCGESEEKTAKIMMYQQC
jgi:hypothetical protein